MSATVRPDNLKAALDAKIAAGLAQLSELRESEQPRITPLNPRELVAALLRYARGVNTVAGGFAKGLVGELQYNSWYEQWKGTLADADRLLWRKLGEGSTEAHDVELIDVEAVLAADPSATHADIRKRVCRFAAYPERSASDVGGDVLRIARRFAGEFIRDHARFLR